MSVLASEAWPAATEYLLLKLDTNRQLLYGMKTSGDGNFHLQRRYNSSTETANDSLVGDAGFWAVQSEFQAYAEATNAFKDLPDHVNKGNLV